MRDMRADDMKELPRQMELQEPRLCNVEEECARMRDKAGVSTEDTDSA